MTTKASVVMAAFNAAGFIRPTIRSVLEQTEKDLELIVVDDGSTDTTADVIRSMDDPRIVLVSQDNRGPSAARNAGIARAASDVIAVIDHDDLWFAPRLETLLDRLREDPQIGFVSSDMFIGDPNRAFESTTILAKRECAGLGFGNPTAWARHCGFSSSTCAVRRGLFERHGVYDESLWYAQDWDLTLRFWLGGEKPSMIPEPLGWTVLRPGQLSEHRIGMACDQETVLKKALARVGVPPEFRAEALRQLRRVRYARMELELTEAAVRAEDEGRRLWPAALEGAYHALGLSRRAAQIILKFIRPGGRAG